MVCSDDQLPSGPNVVPILEIKGRGKVPQFNIVAVGLINFQLLIIVKINDLLSSGASGQQSWLSG